MGSIRGCRGRKCYDEVVKCFTALSWAEHASFDEEQVEARAIRDPLRKGDVLKMLSRPTLYEVVIESSQRWGCYTLPGRQIIDLIKQGPYVNDGEYILAYEEMLAIGYTYLSLVKHPVDYGKLFREAILANEAISTGVINPAILDLAERTRIDLAPGQDA
jgi:hypothetical protein